MPDLRDEILKALKQSDRLTPSELHRRMGGRHGLMDIEAELIAMDLDGVVINDLAPQSRITQKGRKARNLSNLLKQADEAEQRLKAATA
jgi:hypothetical protein